VRIEDFQVELEAHDSPLRDFRLKWKPIILEFCGFLG
jgi:hypothetical protein